MRTYLLPLLMGLVALLAGCSGNLDSYTEALDASELHITGVSVSGLRSTMSVGETQQLTLTGTNDSDETSLDGSWQSSVSAVASVSSSGLVTARAEGEAVVTASYGGYSETYAIEVTSGSLSSIEITTDSSVDACRNVGVAAYGNYSDGSTRNISDLVSWSVDDSQVVIDSSDSSDVSVFSAAATTAVLTASHEGLPGSTTLYLVTTRLQSVAVSPASLSVVVDESASLAATASFSDAVIAPPAAPGETVSVGTTNNAEDITGSISWSSADTAIATVAGGTVTANAEGETTVSASCAGLSGSATVTVTAEAEIVDLVIRVNSSTTSEYDVDYDDVDDMELLAIAVLDDGSTVDVTDDASWSIISSDMTASISNSSGSEGELTVNNLGQLVIMAEYADKDALLVLTVE